MYCISRRIELISSERENLNCSKRFTNDLTKSSIRNFAVNKRTKQKYQKHKEKLSLKINRSDRNEIKRFAKL